MKLFSKSATEGLSVQTGLIAPPKTRNKHRLIKFIALLFILLAITGGYVYYQQKNAPVVNSNACSAISKGASPYLDAVKNQELKPIALKIQGMKDYDKDPKCNLILTTYYVNISDPKNARLNYDVLMQTTKPTKQTETLLTKLTFLEKQAASSKGNIIYLGENK